jgi:DHA1 family multidrug resistance protein-like MFS transporter
MRIKRGFLKNSVEKSDPDAGVFFIVLSQFGFAFSMNIVLSFMPFYILSISKYSPGKTMIWIGLIMGMNSFVMAATAPFWGSLTAKYRPKAMYERVFLFSGVILLLMGFTRSLPLLLILRLLQGGLGGASTMGIFMISRLSSRDRMAGNLSLFQNAITAGQLLAPPVGACIVLKTGYAGPFILSSILIGVVLILLHLRVVEVAPQETAIEPRTSLNSAVVWGWVLSFIATIHLTFLPSILPHVLEGFSLTGDRALKAAGFIMMGYTATALLGNYAISRRTPAAKIKGVIVASCLAAAIFQMMMFFAPGVVSFTVLRMLQTGVIAAVISLVMASLVSEVGGTGIGFLNSARFAGNGAGPLLTTFVVARADLLTLYLIISLSTAGSVLAYLSAERRIGRR